MLCGIPRNGSASGELLKEFNSRRSAGRITNVSVSLVTSNEASRLGFTVRALGFDDGGNSTGPTISVVGG